MSRLALRKAASPRQFLRKSPKIVPEAHWDMARSEQPLPTGSGSCNLVERLFGNLYNSFSFT